MHVLAQIPVMLDRAEIQENFQTRGNEWAERLEELVETLRPLVFAKAVYKVAYVDSRFADGVVIDGIRFTSKVLRKHQGEAGRVFPYVVTIGNGLEEKRRLCTDVLDQRDACERIRDRIGPRTYRSSLRDGDRILKDEHLFHVRNKVPLSRMNEKDEKGRWRYA
jgi:hypothetical protein